MGGIFGGGGKTQSTVDPVAAGLRVQTSAYGGVVPLVYGRTRISGNLAWYGAFTAIPHTESSGGGGKGGGGGGSSNTSWTYTTSFVLALCEGDVYSINAAWRDKEYLAGATLGSVAYSDAVATETFVVPPAPYQIAVANAGTFVSDQGVLSDMLDPCGYPYAVADYSVSGGTYTFPAGMAGKVVHISYAFKQTTAIPPLLTPFLGSYSQMPWSYLEGSFPAESLAYRGVAYIAAANYDLGSDPTLPNHTFDITGKFPFNPGKGIYEANPKDIFVDLLTNSHYGAGFPAANIGDMTAFSNYCVASSLFLSPAYTEQKQASEIITQLMLLTNCDVFYSEDRLKVVPLTDAAVSGNGVSYTPAGAAIYDLTDDDYITSGADDPVRVTRSPNSDAYNQVQVEFYNSQNQWNQEIAEAKDQAAIENFGLRAMDPINAHEITNPAVARRVAQTIMQRAIYIRNTYEFDLGWKYCLIEPGDVVTLTDSRLGLDKRPVRIVGVEENDDGMLSVTAEDYPAGVSAPTLYPSQTGDGYKQDYNVAPGDISPPAFVEAAVFKTKTGLAIGAAVNGVSNTWGGCDVWVSYDDETYKRIGRCVGGARYGTLTAAMTAAPGQTAAVKLHGKPRAILSGSSADAENLSTLCLIDGEYAAYSTSTLTGAGAYSLVVPTRGAYQTAANAHANGARFVRIDETIQWSEDLPLNMIGKTVYFKFCSYNVFGGGQQGLGEVSAYPYTITGLMAKLPPSNVAGFTASADAGGVRLAWDDIADPDRYDYEVRVGATWATGAPVTRVAATEYRQPPIAAGTYQWWIAARDVFMNYSKAPASASLVVTAPSAPAMSIALSSTDYALSWTTPAAMFPVDHYEIRYGASWAAGTAIGSTYGNSFQAPVLFGGTRLFWVAAVDVAGNLGAAASVALTITAPAAPAVTGQVIDNNVLLYWTGTARSLPIDTYEIRRGATFAGATVIGTKSGMFTSVFETQSGSYQYWIVGIDTAGNYGTPGATTLQVSQPPDYVLKANYFSALDGTRGSALLESDGILLPVNTTETFAQHFTTRSWTSPQSQIDAGYPLFIHPAAASGYYEEVIDCGAALASSKVTVAPAITVIAGSPTTSVTISVSSNGTTYTDYPGVTQVFATNFRYIKVRVTVTSTGADLAKLTALNTRLDAKLKTITATVACNAADAGGTVVYITDTGTAGGSAVFVDVDAIQVTAAGTAPVTAIYDFTDTPYPTGFKVLLFNSAGSRVSGTASITVRGY